MQTSRAPVKVGRANALSSGAVVIGNTQGHLIARVVDCAPAESGDEGEAQAAVVVGDAAAGYGDAGAACGAPGLAAWADALAGLAVVVIWALFWDLIAGVGQ